MLVKNNAPLIPTIIVNIGVFCVITGLVLVALIKLLVETINSKM